MDVTGILPQPLEDMLHHFVWSVSHLEDSRSLFLNNSFTSFESAVLQIRGT